MNLLRNQKRVSTLIYQRISSVNTDNMKKKMMLNAMKNAMPKGKATPKPRKPNHPIRIKQSKRAVY